MWLRYNIYNIAVKLVCVCACTRVHVHLCPHGAQKPEDKFGHPILSLPTLSLRQELPLNLALGWQPTSQSNPPVSTSQCGVTGTCRTMPDFLHGLWGFELTSLCLHRRLYDPLSPHFSLGAVFTAVTVVLRRETY